MSSAGVCSGGMEFPKVVGWIFPKWWDGVSRSGGMAFPSQTHSAEYQTQWFCSDVAAVRSDVIKIKLIDCLCLYFKWCFIMLTLNTRRKCRG